MFDEETLARARRLHAATLVFDAHADIPTDLRRWRLRGETRVLERLHLPALREGGVGALVAVCGGDFYHQDALAREVNEAFDAVYAEVAEAGGQARIVRTAAEIEAARRDGALALLLGLEGAGALQGSLAVLRNLYRLGLRVLGLTWNFRNALADGAAEARSGGGLTRFGAAAVVEAQRLGVLLDVSHLADAGVRDVLALAERPIIASHSNARAVCDHIRNLPDWAIEGIARTGGVVGVALFGDFVHPERPTLDRVVAHVDHLRRLVGSEHIAIGPDYTDYLGEAEDEASRAAGIYSGRRWYAEGAETVARLPRLTAALLARGYRESEVAAILGGNLLRVCRATFGG